MADFFAKGNKPINGYGGGNLASKSDLTDIFESGTTASRAISAGTYFYLNGVLVRAIATIASGATFTLNTNYEVVTAGALNDLKKPSFRKVYDGNATYTAGLSANISLPTGYETEYFPIYSWVNANAVSFISRTTDGWKVYLPQSTGFSGSLRTVIYAIQII